MGRKQTLAQAPAGPVWTPALAGALERAVLPRFDVAMTKIAIPDPKGHRATSPWQMPRAAWKDIASRTWQRTWDDNVGLVAAGVAFYGFFALLSLLAMIVLIYGLAADPSTVIDTMQTLTDVLPNDVAALIGDQLIQALTADRASQPPGRPPSRWAWDAGPTRCRSRRGCLTRRAHRSPRPSAFT